jgi:hypothetical protein
VFERIVGDGVAIATQIHVYERLKELRALPRIAAFFDERTDALDERSELLGAREPIEIPGLVDA